MAERSSMSEKFGKDYRDGLMRRELDAAERALSHVKQAQDMVCFSALPNPVFNHLSKAFYEMADYARELRAAIEEES